MKLSQLAATPQLIKIEIADEDIIAEYGESLEFYTWDRQPMSLFIKLAAAQNNDLATMMDTVRTLILDENGNPVIQGDMTLPTNVLMRVITTVVERVGK